MPHNPYYTSVHWRRLRRLALVRDGFRCTVVGCGAIAAVVDHIVTRPRSDGPTPVDRLDNLRSLCRAHDTQIKELPGGRTRRRGGQPAARGSDADGWPRGR